MAAYVRAWVFALEDPGLVFQVMDCTSVKVMPYRPIGSDTYWRGYKLKEARNVAQLFTQLFNFIQSLPSIEFSMMKLFVALSCAVAALAQGISIGAPAPGATLAAGSDVVVSVIKPVSFLSSPHI